jgi:hypothetical protein
MGIGTTAFKPLDIIRVLDSTQQPSQPTRTVLETEDSSLPADSQLSATLPSLTTSTLPSLTTSTLPSLMTSTLPLLPTTTVPSINQARFTAGNLEKTIPGSIHGNNYLLMALAYGFQDAAIDIMMHMPKSALDIPDKFSSSKSTPLILAAKTMAVKAAFLLLGLGANPNAQDHMGFTALHYASILKHNDLIEALRIKGAKESIKNKYGKRPSDYYFMKINFDDLRYHYGDRNNPPEKMGTAFDHTEKYHGTETKDFSALRWFAIIIIRNLGLGKQYLASTFLLDNKYYVYCWPDKLETDAVTEDTSLFDITTRIFKKCSPVIDQRVYDKAMHCLIDFRNQALRQSH